VPEANRAKFRGQPNLARSSNSHGAMIRFASPLHHQLEPSLQFIEVSSLMAIPSFRVVGLPGPEIVESCERVRAAIHASELEFPKRRVLVNLSPAGIRKQGTGTDLAIALAVISVSAQEKSRTSSPDRLVVASAELALDGRVRSAGRILRTCLAAVRAGATDLVLSHEDKPLATQALKWICEAAGREAATHLRISTIRELKDALTILQDDISVDFSGSQDQQSFDSSDSSLDDHQDLLPLSLSLERTLACSIAGRHHLLLLGPKGTGKTASLHWMKHVQGELGPQEFLDRMLLRELNQPTLRPSDCVRVAPLRIVSPQVRPEALIGGAQRGELRPGEFSQAHGGVLLADEFLEWPRDSRECLRDPMETGRVHLNRSQLTASLPARFQLAATANLCRCGGWPAALLRYRSPHTHPTPCRCSGPQREEYLERLSGPLLDRMDLVQLVLDAPSTSCSVRRVSRDHVHTLRNRIERCHQRLVTRWGKPPGLLSGSEVEKILELEPVLEKAWNSLKSAQDVSLRRRHKEIRVALTLAAWDETAGAAAGLPSLRHFEEARNYSAEGWLRNLSPTPLRGHTNLATSVDPKNSADYANKHP